MTDSRQVILTLDTSALIRAAKALPETAGVYQFLGEDDYPVYIGKSINLKQRVLSHLYAAKQDPKEHKIARGTRRISHQETEGEFSALLLESQQVKAYLPLFNRQLRRQKKLFAFKLDQSRGYHAVTLCEAIWPPKSSESYFGLYASHQKAKKHLLSLARVHQLCKRCLGLETGSGPCFGYQLKQCLGACKGVETSASHNARLAAALAGQAVNHWPYQGPIAVIEGNAKNAHVFDQWNYLGVINRRALKCKKITLKQTASTLDRDTYRILTTYLEKADAGLKVLPLSAELL